MELFDNIIIVIMYFVRFIVYIVLMIVILLFYVGLRIYLFILILNSSRNQSLRYYPIIELFESFS
jgi:hypothetical protein